MKTNIFLACFLIITALLSEFAVFAEQCEDITDESIRVHIVANSNSTADQEIKLAIRDELQAHYATQLSAPTKQEAVAQLSQLLPDISKRVNLMLLEHGFGYTAEVSISDMYFETREYEDDIVMPPGNYTAIHVNLGEHTGENWWCVMYPPLCIPVASEGQALEVEERISSLSDEEALTPKLAVLELWNDVKAVFLG